MSVTTVPLLDLNVEYAPLRAELLAAMTRVLDNHQFIMGPEVAALEQELGTLLGVTHAIGVSSGTDAILASLMAARVGPGDEVIIPAPYWLSYPEMVRLAGGEPVIVSTKESNGWKMTAEEFEDAMSPRTKMVIINSPGNPTGAVYTEDELRAIGDVALGEDILILSDEIYEKLTYDDVKHVFIA